MWGKSSRPGPAQSTSPRRVPRFPRLAAGTWARGAAACGAGAAILAVLCWTGLNHDVRYALGCLRVAERGGLSSAETFVHRPLAYRWILAGLDSLTTGPLVVRESLLRLLVVAVVAATAMWLRAGLSRFLRPAEAATVAATTGLALALAPNWDFLQPEWMAAELATAGVAAALWFRSDAVAAIAGGALLVLAVLVKYSTAPTAVIALGVIGVLARRRAVLTAMATITSGAALFALTVWVEPHEWRWLGEMPLLNPGSSVRDGLGRASLDGLVRTIENEALLLPAFALLPVSVVLLVRLAPDRRARRAWVVLPSLAVLCVLAALVAQGQWFEYHLAVLPVFSAGLWGLAMARWIGVHGRPPWAAIAVTGALALCAPLTAAAPLAWRMAHGRIVYIALAVVLLTAVGLAAVAAPAVRSAGGAVRPAAAALIAPLVVGVLAVAVPVWPTAPYSFDSGLAGYTALTRVANRERVSQQLDGVRNRIGKDAPVTYLAFGDVDYLLGNPTTCRFPSPVFLQRTRYSADLNKLASFRENLRCLDNQSARYAVIDTNWFPLAAVDPLVRTKVKDNYDCGDAAIRTGNFLICPRR